MATQTELIKGKVARILSSREVALTVGESHGVETGMKFDILYPKGLPIVDPDTGEDLGFVDMPKGRVRVSRVHDKFSVARTYRTKRVNVGGSASLGISQQLFQPPRWVNRLETLKIEQSSPVSNEDEEERQGYVSIGDTVIQVLDEE